MEDDRARKLLLFQVHKDVSALYKRCLNILEMVQDDYYQSIEKMEKSLPPEYNNLISLSNVLDEEKYNYYRKQVLDIGNDSIRELNKLIENFNIDFK